MVNPACSGWRHPNWVIECGLVTLCNFFILWLKNHEFYILSVNYLIFGLDLFSNLSNSEISQKDSFKTIC